MVEKIHRQAHLGVQKTIWKVRLDYYWSGLTADVRRLVLSCLLCQQSKVTPVSQPKNNHHLYAGRPWQIVSLDIVGPFCVTPSGNKVILTVTDHFTRWSDAIPLPDGTAATVARALDEKVFNYFGVPESIHTDMGSNFESTLFAECCKLWGCQKTRCSPYHPTSNSVIERTHRTLGSSLRALLIGREQHEWDRMLPQISRALRSTPHATISWDHFHATIPGKRVTTTGAIGHGTRWR